MTLGIVGSIIFIIGVLLVFWGWKEFRSEPYGRVKFMEEMVGAYIASNKMCGGLTLMFVGATIFFIMVTIKYFAVN